MNNSAIPYLTLNGNNKITFFIDCTKLPVMLIYVDTIWALLTHRPYVYITISELDLPPPPKTTADPGRRTKTPPHSKIEDAFHHNKHNKKIYRGKVSGTIGQNDALEADADRSYLTAPVVPTTPHHVDAPRVGQEGAHHATSPPRFYFPGVENKAMPPRHLPGTLPLAMCAILPLVRRASAF